MEALGFGGFGGTSGDGYTRINSTLHPTPAGKDAEA
jgi:hypothetical protein